MAKHRPVPVKHGTEEFQECSFQRESRNCWLLLGLLGKSSRVFKKKLYLGRGQTWCRALDPEEFRTGCGRREDLEGLGEGETSERSLGECSTDVGLRPMLSLCLCLGIQVGILREGRPFSPLYPGKRTSQSGVCCRKVSFVLAPLFVPGRGGIMVWPVG